MSPKTACATKSAWSNRKAVCYTAHSRKHPYGREGANDTDMIAAAQQAEAHEFIQTLEDQSGNTGYDSTVGERGVKLSGSTPTHRAGPCDPERWTYPVAGRSDQRIR